MAARSSLAAALVAAVAVVVPARAGAAQLPCGLLEPVDRVFDCPAETSAAADTELGTSAAAAGAGEPSATWRDLAAVGVDPARLLVRFEPGTTRAAAARASREAGGSLERRLPPLGLDVVRAEPERLGQVRSELERSPIVRSVSPEQLVGLAAVRPDDAHWPSQTGLHVTRFADAWETTTGSAAIVVAVVDTGVAASHPDLAGAVLPGRDVLQGDDDPSDDHGHGTAVAGIIAARANNAAGIAGVCWLCRILPVKALGAEGKGPTSAIAAGVLWATDHGASVINLSLGSPQSTAALAGAIDYATSRGVVVVAAAGNQGVAEPFYPAAERGVVAVAATDDRDRAFSWSNHGPWVQLAAPGCLPTTLSSGGYGVACGTSVAAPVASGLAALALSSRPGLSAGTVVDALRRGAVPVGPFVRDGRIDAARTLATLATAESTQTTASARSMLTRARRVRTFPVRGGAGLWAVTATFDRRRRLTVTVLDDSGTVVRTARGRSPVRLLERLPAGVYRIRVAGTPGAFRLSIARPATPSNE